MMTHSGMELTGRMSPRRRSARQRSLPRLIGVCPTRTLVGADAMTYIGFSGGFRFSHESRIEVMSIGVIVFPSNRCDCDLL
jgi:hypothetical protein